MQLHNNPSHGKLHKKRRPTRRSTKRLESTIHILCLGEKVQEPPPIYDSYYSEEDEMVTDVQREWFTSK